MKLVYNYLLIMTTTMAELCRMWNNAGERPYEVFSDSERAIFDHILAGNSISNVTLYRGTQRHGDKQIGEIIDYDRPTSWTSSQEISQRFIDGLADTCILVMASPCGIVGLYNNWADYDEKEYIIAPIKLVIKNKVVINNYMMVYVSSC